MFFTALGRLAKQWAGLLCLFLPAWCLFPSFIQVEPLVPIAFSFSVRLRLPTTALIFVTAHYLWGSVPFVSFPKGITYPNISQYLYLPPAHIILLSSLCPPVPSACSCHLAELLQGFEIAASGFSSFLQLLFQHPPSDRSEQTDVAEPDDAFLPVDSRKNEPKCCILLCWMWFWGTRHFTSPLIHKDETVVYTCNSWKL